jgi:predicted nuclease of predicted toxin-antitoxin system
VRLLIDDCVEVGLAVVLRAAGHDVVLVQEIEPSADDIRVMRLATEQDRLLVTADKDFGDLGLRQQHPVPGLVLVRIPPEQRHLVGPRVAMVLAEFGDRLAGHHTVVQATKVRIRPLRIETERQ